MHGRKRVDLEALAAKESMEQKEKRLAKIGKYNALSAEMLKRRNGCVYDQESFKLCEKLLSVNPEYYTVWNFRRECLQHFFNQNPDEIASRCVNELSVTETALRKNPKSYVAWFQRTWVLENSPSTDWNEELELCNKFLALDARNFHCWNHRRMVVEHAQISPQQEFEYTTSLINDNFSNYSAWHYRSLLLGRMKESMDALAFRCLLDKEYQLVKSAFYTEPDDQSAWLYHRWLLSNETRSITSISNLTLESSVSEQTDEDVNTERLVEELRVCQELLESEPNCKWALMTCAVLIVELDKHSVDVKEAKETLFQRFGSLAEIDPLRKQYYKALTNALWKSE